MADRNRHRIQRGEILRMLNHRYPEQVGDNLLRSTFAWHSLGEIDQNVAYLVDQGYAWREDVNPDLWPESTARYLVRITPKGINLLEGSIERDPGIELPRMR